MSLRNAPPAARTSYMSLSAARTPGGCATTSSLGGRDELMNDESGEESGEAKTVREPRAARRFQRGVTTTHSKKMMKVGGREGGRRLDGNTYPRYP